MNVVMLANNACIFDARIRREAAALAEAGHRVTVLATSADGAAEREHVAGVAYHRLFRVREIEKGLKTEETRTGTSWIRRLKALAFHIGRRLITPSVRHLIGYALAYRQAIRALEPDVVHAHDLDTLLAGWIGARRTGAKLVYDAHELETDRNLPMIGFERTYRAVAEHWLIRRADAVITVSDSIAVYLAKRYRIERPQVVLNSPIGDAVDDGSQEGDLRTDLGLSQATPLAVYIGGVMPGRGLDLAVRSLRHLPDLELAMLGPRQAHAANELLCLARTLGVQERLHLCDPVRHERVQRYIAHADVSLILIQDSCLSYRYCFPNKLLQSLFAGLPVVVSRLVELERMVTQSGAGLVVDETDPAAIAQGISRILADPERYRPDTATRRSLKESYGWPAQQERLLACYDQLGRSKDDSLEAQGQSAAALPPQR